MANSNTDFRSFYTEYGKAIDNREAALFIGAGLSVGAKFKTWPDLLRDVAKELKLDIDKETDLVALAQFHFNERRVRTRLNQLLVDEYDREVPITENHKLIAKLPVEAVWTTNYDQLIEKAFREAGKIGDVKVTTENFATSRRGREVIIYKMHGDASQPHEAVLMKEDYELYGIAREAFTNALKGDLVSKSILFLGFSFTDPNIDYILSRIRVLMGQNPRQHYCIMKWPSKPKSRSQRRLADYDYDMRRLELRIGDLKRYGIEALMIDDFAEITEILKNLNKQAHRNNVFVSGSVHTYSAIPQDRIEKLARMIGKRIIKGDFSLVSGLGLGIGGAVLIGAMEEVYSDDRSPLLDRIIMRPFPQLSQSSTNRTELYRRYREDIVSRVGYTIFLCGNKLDSTTGKIVAADGVMQEFKITQSLGKYPIPIGATDDVAKKIWNKVMAAPDKFYPGINVNKQLKILGNPNKSNEQIVDAIFTIIKRTQSR